MGGESWFALSVPQQGVRWGVRVLAGFVGRVLAAEIEPEFDPKRRHAHSWRGTSWAGNRFTFRFRILGRKSMPGRGSWFCPLLAGRHVHLGGACR